MNPWVPDEHLAQVGTLITEALVMGSLIMLVAQTARGRLSPLVSCALATIAFLLANKVYSPQYDLWLVPFLVMLPVRTKLVVHFYASSLTVFVLSYAISHLVNAPLFLYFMGAAVLYRVGILALITRDYIQISSVTKQRPFLQRAPLLGGTVDYRQVS